MSFLNLGELTALSHNFSERMLNDTYYNKHVLLEAMRRTKKTYPGGLHIQVELGIAGDDTDQTGGAISATGSWDYTNPELFDAATFLPKLEVQVIVVWDIEVSRNGTAETQYLDLHQRTSSVVHEDYGRSQKPVSLWTRRSDPSQRFGKHF